MNLHEIIQEDIVLEFLKMTFPYWTWQRTGPESIDFTTTVALSEPFHIREEEYRTFVRRAHEWNSQGRPPA